MRINSVVIAGFTVAVCSLAACADQTQPTAPKAAPAPAAAVAIPVAQSNGSTVCLAYMNKQSIARMRAKTAQDRHEDVETVADLQAKSDKIGAIAADACN